MSPTKKQTELYSADDSEKMFFKIREVAKIADVKQHVLRYWESEFPNLKPKKNRNGQRTYSRRDIDLVLDIKKLLHEEKYSIAGARQSFKKRKKGSSKKGTKATEGQILALVEVREGLAELLTAIKKTP